MAPQPQPAGALELSEDRRWQAYLWRAQRVGWALMAVFVLAAILGLTGSGGPLADATVRTPAGSVEYPRISRWASKERIVFVLPAAAQGSTELTLATDFDAAFAVDSIVPLPASGAATALGHRYTFDVAGAGAKEIVFNVTTGSPALIQRIGVRIGDGPLAELGVTILP